MPSPPHADDAPPEGAVPLGATAYLAAEGWVDELVAELGDVRAIHDRLVIADGPPRPAAWAANVWCDPWTLPVASIGEAARALRSVQRNWSLFSVACHRRAALVVEKLPKISARPLVFPAPAPTAPLGSFTLLDEHTLLAAPRCTSPFLNGEVRFVEDRDGPPNRAYRKLWEAFTVLGEHPRAGQRVVDLGASPGGWTWVSAELGADVIAVDKAPLDPVIAARPEVTERVESAFGIDPASLGPVDWMTCDVICYPSRLLSLLERWLDAGTCERFVCTVKFQGETDRETARALSALDGARLVHLHHNKHELTWMWGVD
jgi:23S rRNA (cytidine2498-2'-O)-methyltransferase